MDTLLLEALNAIDPAELSREEWVQVGMGLKESGESCDVWETWSAKDPARYHPGECARLWASFRRDGISGGTIVHMARERGWDGGGEVLDWDSPISLELDDARRASAPYIELFLHCNHCRADAIGVPGKTELSRQVYAIFKRAANVRENFSHG